MAEFEFPYQVVAFLGEEPKVGEPVYGGQHGWYPQIALKRRFRIDGMDEEQLIQKITEFCSSFGSFTIRTGELVQPERMPVKVVKVNASEELVGFHTGLIKHLGDNIESRYPNREHANYLPHITAEYGGKMVINPDKFTNREFSVSSIWLLKDIDSEDSIAYKKLS